MLLDVSDSLDGVTVKTCHLERSVDFMHEYVLDDEHTRRAHCAGRRGSAPRLPPELFFFLSSSTCLSCTLATMCVACLQAL